MSEEKQIEHMIVDERQIGGGTAELHLRNTAHQASSPNTWVAWGYFVFNSARTVKYVWDYTKVLMPSETLKQVGRHVAAPAAQFVGRRIGYENEARAAAYYGTEAISFAASPATSLLYHTTQWLAGKGSAWLSEPGRIDGLVTNISYATGVSPATVRAELQDTIKFSISAAAAKGAGMIEASELGRTGVTLLDGQVKPYVDRVSQPVGDKVKQVTGKVGNFVDSLGGNQPLRLTREEIAKQRVLSEAQEELLKQRQIAEQYEEELEHFEEKLQETQQGFVEKEEQLKKTQSIKPSKVVKNARTHEKNSKQNQSAGKKHKKNKKYGDSCVKDACDQLAGEMGLSQQEHDQLEKDIRKKVGKAKGKKERKKTIKKQIKKAQKKKTACLQEEIKETEAQVSQASKEKNHVEVCRDTAQAKLNQQEDHYAEHRSQFFSQANEPQKQKFLCDEESRALRYALYSSQDKAAPSFGSIQVEIPCEELEMLLSDELKKMGNKIFEDKEVRLKISGELKVSENNGQLIVNVPIRVRSKKTKYGMKQRGAEVLARFAIDIDSQDDFVQASTNHVECRVNRHKKPKLKFGGITLGTCTHICQDEITAMLKSGEIKTTLQSAIDKYTKKEYSLEKIREKLPLGTNISDITDTKVVPIIRDGKIFLDINLSMGVQTLFPYKNLAEKITGCGLPFDARVEKVNDISFSDGKLICQLKLSGKINGSYRIEAVPRYDQEAEEIYFEKIDGQGDLSGSSMIGQTFFSQVGSLAKIPISGRLFRLPVRTVAIEYIDNSSESENGVNFPVMFDTNNLTISDIYFSEEGINIGANVSANPMLQPLESAASPNYGAHVMSCQSRCQ